MKMLVVDDSGIMRKVIIRELLKLNVLAEHIEEAVDGEEAVQKANHGTYNLILMDWNMPNMLGIDAVKAIRDGGIETPILMVTTEAERANVITAIQAGANNYLVKPFTNEALHEKILQLVPDLLTMSSDSPPVESSEPPVPQEPRVHTEKIDLDTGQVILD